MEKYGRDSGPLQEQEGPAEAEKMMKLLGFEPEVIERVSYLVGHHHTYTNIDGIDYQILVEADFLVNYFENGMETETIQKSVKKIFQTESVSISRQRCFPRRNFRCLIPGHRMACRNWMILLRLRGSTFASKADRRRQQIK